MLSRVADALFWMSRYLERAEHIARLLDVCFHLEMDLRGVLAGLPELNWTSLAAILQQQPVPPHRFEGASPQAALSAWLTFDLQNPESIMSCVSRARYNARSIRGSINSEMWKELNKLYWQLCDPAFSNQARESPHEFYWAVECGSHLVQGVCDATLTHEEGWQFIQLGKFLERAGKTLRILDIQYQLLQELIDPGDRPLANLQWAAVLRSCRAYEAYQKLYVGRIEPEHVVDFLLLHAESPRSVRFSLESAAQALMAIEGASGGRGHSKAVRLLGQVLSDLKFAELEQILKGDLHQFLSGVMDRCNQVSRAIQAQYSLQ
ncbi:MAG: alpha-E domain-containing protein [Gemmataceae bacterium]|nr:alpha-E domain-containing protein [Gemmataceae bacterium]